MVEQVRCTGNWTAKCPLSNSNIFKSAGKTGKTYCQLVAGEIFNPRTNFIWSRAPPFLGVERLTNWPLPQTSKLVAVIHSSGLLSKAVWRAAKLKSMEGGGTGRTGGEGRGWANTSVGPHFVNYWDWGLLSSTRPNDFSFNTWLFPIPPVDNSHFACKAQV